MIKIAKINMEFTISRVLASETTSFQMIAMTLFKR